MPPDPADGQLTDYQLSPEDLKQLAAEMARMFPTEDRTTDFLRNVVRVPPDAISGFKHGPDPADYETPEAYWRRVIPELQRGSIIELPLRQLVRSVRIYKQTTAWFDAKFPREQAFPEAARAGGARGAGCHAIIWTGTVNERLEFFDWLKREGLAPWVVWPNREMTSFGVSETDPQRLARRIRPAYAERLVKVIPPGEPDGLIRLLTVRDGAGVELDVPDVPIQLTVAQVGEAAARYHPSADSRRKRPDAAESQPEFADHFGGGMEQRVPIDGTLVEHGIIEQHTVAIESLKFGQIKVVFVCANPEQLNGNKSSRTRSGFGRELSEIRNKVAPQYQSSVPPEHLPIKLVHDIQDVTRDHLGDIFRHKPDAIHLACHVEGNQFFWNDGHDGPETLPAQKLADEFTRRGKGQLSFIVLSACHGDQTGEPFVRAARDVIVHPGLLSDTMAEKFTGRFYDELSRTPVPRMAAQLAATRISHTVDIYSRDAQGWS